MKRALRIAGDIAMIVGLLTLMALLGLLCLWWLLPKAR